MPKLATIFCNYARHANFGIRPKLAETALLFYRVTDVSFLPKMDQMKQNGIGNRLGREGCTRCE